ncbi:MAG: GSCFA domain-containing protein [Flavobacteriales bacterium]|nr:GSCFA domain-containing protein [Flavobacteriales bacterium]
MKNDKIFRKIVQIVKNNNINLTHNSSLIMIGSCFSLEVGKRLKKACFEINQPFGTIFNPITIGNNLLRIIDKDNFTKNDLIEQNNVFYSWHHSSKNYYDNDSTALIKKVNGEIDSLNKSFSKNPILILTFGTSIVYEYNNKIVGNCHKQPSNHFQKRRLSIEDIVSCWKNIIKKCPDQHFIFTVSPVRHYKDGIVENNRSKAVLILAIDELVKLFPNQISYFPSYEIIMDELRDYRFYNADMIHPNKESVEYIWIKFQETYMNNKTIEIINKCDKLRQALDHKPFLNSSKEYEQFLENLKQKIASISNQTPLYNWSDEIVKINSELA